MSVKKFRPIRLQANAAVTIAPIVKELVKALNQQRTDIRSFAASQRINFSKVYNWIAGRAQPKNNSIGAIHRYFKKIKFRYAEKPEKNVTKKASTRQRNVPATVHASHEAIASIMKVLNRHSEALQEIREMIKNDQEEGKKRIAGIRKKEM